MKTNKKEKVLIYALYSEDNIDRGLEKEKQLERYCADKNYEILRVVRKPHPYEFFEIVKDFVNIIKPSSVYDDIHNVGFEKVIVYDVTDITLDTSSLLTLLTILKCRRVTLETIKQGKLNFNPFDKEDILSDDYMYESYEYSKNKKYFVDEEPLF